MELREGCDAARQMGSDGRSLGKEEGLGVMEVGISKHNNSPGVARSRRRSTGGGSYPQRLDKQWAGV